MATKPKIYVLTWDQILELVQAGIGLDQVEVETEALRCIHKFFWPGSRWPDDQPQLADRARGLS